ncbi:MAG: alpha/beta hydrolase [Acidobacteriaceae bacterium]|jgi:pimeloyl-ACP methyl ester carboxylesterase
MPRYVILCGSETIPRTWRTLQSLLSTQDDPCSIVDWSDISWNTGVDFALDAIAERIGTHADTVLVGHSIAGLLLPLLADRLHAMAEIYIAALIPEAGRSFFDRIFSDENIFHYDWMIGYNDLQRSKDPLATHRDFLSYHLFHDCPADTVDSSWVRSDVPINQIYEFAYPEAQLSRRYRHYVICGDDRSIQPRWQRIAARTLCGVNRTIIGTGHCPQISNPQVLADLLLTIGARVRATDVIPG